MGDDDLFKWSKNLWEVWRGAWMELAGFEKREGDAEIYPIWIIRMMDPVGSR